MDVIRSIVHSMAGIYRSDSVRLRIAVTLKGRSPNTHGIGAKSLVYGGAVPVQSQQIISGGRYLSCDQAMRVFAAGFSTNHLRIEVDWPSGRRSDVADVVANYIYEIDESSASAAPVQPAPVVKPFFEDVSA